MKKMIAAFACLTLVASSLTAQETLTSVVDSDVILTSVQEPAPDTQPSANDVVTAPAQQESAPAQQQTVVEGQPLQMESACGGCAPVVANYAVPASNCCCNAQTACCSNRGLARLQLFGRFRGRLTSFGGRNNCCY